MANSSAQISIEEAVVQYLPSSETPAAKKRKSQDVADGPSSSPKRKCKPHACLRCRKSHIDCGGNLPGTSACKACTKKKHTCEYGTDDRTNTSKRDELARRIQSFKETVNDYYNVIYSMYLSLTRPDLNSPGAATANLAREQCGILTPKIICQMLENKGWAYVPSPSYPQFCATAATMTSEGVKLNDTRKAINAFKKNAQDYVKHLHTAYRMLGERLPVPQDPVIECIGSTLTKNIMFLTEDFEYLATLDDNPHRSISPSEIANIDNELNKDVRSSTPPRAAQPSPSLSKSFEYIDLTGDDTPDDGGSIQSNDRTPSLSYGSSSEALQTLAGSNQPAQAPVQPATGWDNSLDLNLLGVGDWANSASLESLIPDPFFDMEEALGFQALQNALKEPDHSTENEPGMFNWPTEFTGEYENIFAEEIPGFDLGLAPSDHQPPSQI